MRHRRNPGPFAHITLAQELDGLAAYMVGLDEDERDEFDFYDEIRPILNRHLGRPLGPSADWVNPTWRLGGDLYLFEGDYDDFDVVFRVSADDPDEDDVIEQVEHLPNFAALRRYFRERERRNPSRKPPPSQHTFALEASAVQQGLFAPSSYEAKPQKEKPRPVVDERQVDLFAPPPPKKNPEHGVKWQKYGPKGVDWEGEWLVTVDGQQFRAWRDPEIDSFWFVPASDTTTSLHGAVFDKKSPAVHAGFSREECIRAMRKFSVSRKNPRGARARRGSCCR